MRLSSSWWVLLGFLAIAGFFLVSEHQAHIFGALPYLLLLACPLLHWFMHRGHGGHGRDGGHRGHAGHGDGRQGGHEVSPASPGARKA